MVHVYSSALARSITASNSRTCFFHVIVICLCFRYVCDVGALKMTDVKMQDMFQVSE